MTTEEKMIVSNLLMSLWAYQKTLEPRRMKLATLDAERAALDEERSAAESVLDKCAAKARLLIHAAE